MNANKYQKLAMRTNDGKASDRLIGKIQEYDMKFSNEQSNKESVDIGGIFNACLGLSGEVGDILWYVVMLCESFGWNMEEIMQMNVDKLKARYPGGFDVERANHRAVGDV